MALWLRLKRLSTPVGKRTREALLSTTGNLCGLRGAGPNPRPLPGPPIADGYFYRNWEKLSMGAYMSRPNTHKESAELETALFKCGVAAMQGWRTEMEDAHLVTPELDGQGTGLFGVFDGHGGKEVAKFAALYLGRELQDTQAYKAGDLATALSQAYLAIDRQLVKEEWRPELEELARGAGGEGGAGGERPGDRPHIFVDEADLPEVLREALAGARARAAERATAGGDAVDGPAGEDDEEPWPLGMVEVDVEEEGSSSGEEGGGGRGGDADEEGDAEDDGEDDQEGVELAGMEVVGRRVAVAGDSPEEAAPLAGDRPEEAVPHAGALTDGAPDAVAKLANGNPAEAAAGGDSSMGAAGARSPAANGSKRKRGTPVREGGRGGGRTGPGGGGKGKAPADVKMAGQPEAELDSSDDDTAQEGGLGGGGGLRRGRSGLRPEGYLGPSAGCTAVVALVRGNELVVANAGDSRCVVSRGGAAIPMTRDHKPTDEDERARITKAGGFVAEGRVNGSLNLSRALGDMEYKQSAQLGPAEQMVTAVPEVRQLDLLPGDEFLILACDGIWDVLTCQEAVDFARERLVRGETPRAVCEAMCDRCLAPDTAGCGKGCDNMSAMVVLLKPFAGLLAGASGSAATAGGSAQAGAPAPAVGDAGAATAPAAPQSLREAPAAAAPPAPRAS